MSERTLRTLFTVLGVTVVLWVVTSFVGGRSGGAANAPDELAGFFEEISPDGVTAVRMSGPGGSVELTREGGRWRVNGHAADSGTVARFWKSVEEAEVGSLAASNPANHARMGVAADSAWTLEFETGSSTRSILVGRTGPRFRTAYVRLPEDDGVYVLEGDLRTHVVRAESEWRNKRMTSVDTSLVARVEVTRDGKRYALVRGDSAWSVAGGDAADDVTVRSLLGEIADLRASGFYDPDDEEAASPRGGSVVALSEEGDTLAAVTFGSGSGDRWARVEGDPEIYRIATWRLDRLAPAKDKVVKDS